MSDSDIPVRIGIHRSPRTEPERAGVFISAAQDYSRLGISCFNQCIDPNGEVTKDTLRGMEKRCMDGCLTVNLQNFSIYGTQFSR